MLCATNFTGTSTCNRSSSRPFLIDDDDTNFTARVDEKTSLRRCASDTQQPDDDDAFRRRDRAAAAHNRDMMMVALSCNLKEREEKARSKMTLFCMGSSKAIFMSREKLWIVFRRREKNDFLRRRRYSRGV